jgi:hypothetical protein
MSHHLSKAHRQQQVQQSCTVCMLFRSMGRGQYRSSYDREMYLHHLQIAHGVQLVEEREGPIEPRGVVLKR